MLAPLCCHYGKRIPNLPGQCGPAGLSSDPPARILQDSGQHLTGFIPAHARPDPLVVEHVEDVAIVPGGGNPPGPRSGKRQFIPEIQRVQRYVETYKFHQARSLHPQHALRQADPAGNEPE